ncbi:uncharacterized protein N7529_008408 [Penicillium soppii]|jgi:hypothetical protein|uniref:uncharacterized protein n=1 Tax=Penicillium soppii TaxID=69789 RepID=UPI0025472D1C|nr:uncharacterized protein N7529_008408 [Penicillium soppii]KAJ5861098.1 hypothetical protein N7529_008408 [Penicillium soppii]
MGMGARIYSSEDVGSFGAYGAQNVLLLIGPTLSMLTVNITQVKMMQCLKSENMGLLPARFRLPTYLTLNVVLLVIQLIGTVIYAMTQNIALVESASKLLTATYVCQMVFWIFTLVENVFWSIRFGRHSASNQSMMPHWKLYNQLFGLAVSIVALGRNLVRLTQLGMGPTGFLSVNEWPSYAFDFYQLAVILLGWGVFYLPGVCKEIQFKQVHEESQSHEC